MAVTSPRVSIGLPVFNGANFLRVSIDSILGQDYNDLELIIADNASTDETESICREYAAKDIRVRYIRNKTNLGAAGNYNKVFEVARGQYFKWAAHDDECHPSMIRRCAEYLDQAPRSVTMVYPLGELIDETGKTLSSPLDRIESTHPSPYRRLARVMWALNMCDPVFGLIRSDYLRRTQLIGPFFGADYILLGELAMLGEIREINEVLFRLRAHSHRSMTAHSSKRARAAWFAPNAGRRRLLLPNWERMVVEMMRSATRAPLPVRERMLCIMATPSVHYWRRFRNAGGRWKAQLKAWLGLRSRNQTAASHLKT